MVLPTEKHNVDKDASAFDLILKTNKAVNDQEQKIQELSRRQFALDAKFDSAIPGGNVERHYDDHVDQQSERLRKLQLTHDIKAKIISGIALGTGIVFVGLFVTLIMVLVQRN